VANPKVSVLITTYNHEAFIGEALDGVLMQKTSFPIEIVINDDASTDNAPNIIRAYWAKYPEIIRPFFQPKNRGSTPNMADAYCRCTGEYVALLDGDDYWIDPYKLEKQVALMDAHPEYSLSFTKEGRVSPCYQMTPGTGTCSEFTLKDLLHNDTMMGTSTVMCRRALLSEIPAEYYHQWGTDFYLYVLFARQGPIGYIDDVTAIYRVHPASQTQRPGQVSRTLGILQTRLDVDALLEHKYHHIFQLARRYADVSLAYLDEAHDYEKARYYLSQAIRRIPFELSFELSWDSCERVLIAFLRINFPAGYRATRVCKHLLRSITLKRRNR
jgi:glycosyltransferase involved in cell wall biosynthesis